MEHVGGVIATNESVLKYILQHTWHPVDGTEPKDISFDKLFLLCTRTVSNVNDTIGVSSYDYFINRMVSFYECNEKDSRIFTDNIVPIPCDSDLSDIKGIKRSIIDVSQKILDFKATLDDSDTVRLYMDSTGGPRNAAMILLVISRIMEYHGIEVAEIYYASMPQQMNSSKVPEITVQPILDVYQLLDLVAGFEEFNLFGSAKKLNEHFHRLDEGTDKTIQVLKETADRDVKTDGSESIITVNASNQLLAAIDDFSEAIKISKRGSFETSIKKLDESLMAMQLERKQKKDDVPVGDDTDEDITVFDQDIFQLLQKPIEKSYEMLLENHRNNISDDLVYIDWCLDHGYLQQALTLFCEYVPVYAVEQGIIAYNPDAFPQEDSGVEYRSVPMRVFNTINANRGAARSQGHMLSDLGTGVASEADKDILAPSITKYVSCALTDIKLYTAQVLVKEKEKDSSRRDELTHAYIDKVMTDLELDINTLLKGKGFTLYPLEQQTRKKSTLLEWIHCLGAICRDGAVLTKEFNTQYLGLRQHLIKEVFKSTACKPHIYINMQESIVHFRKPNPYAIRVVKNALLSFVIQQLQPQHYKALIVYKLPRINQPVVSLSQGSLVNSIEGDTKRLIEDSTRLPHVKLYENEDIYIPTKMTGTVRDTLQFLYLYYEIKKSRNDSNHANKEIMSQYKTSTDLTEAMRLCLTLARKLSHNKTIK